MLSVGEKLRLQEFTALESGNVQALRGATFSLHQEEPTYSTFRSGEHNVAVRTPGQPTRRPEGGTDHAGGALRHRQPHQCIESLNGKVRSIR